MRITVDSNLLVRALIGDDAQQSELAQSQLASASLVAIALPTLCELVWVLSKGYGIASSEIADAVRRLMSTTTVAVNRLAVEAGLAAMEEGGDFADGVAAFDGQWLGGETFVSFDKRTVLSLRARGLPARQLE